MSDRTSDLEAGTVVGAGYELVRPIGRGGSASVYAARRRGEPDEVAVKVLAVDPSEPARTHRRFWDEVALGSRIRHPNVASVRDFGVCAETGRPYLVMELLPGEDLRSVLRARGPLDEERVLRLFAGVADALALAHEAGVVHKDVKPANLFLRRTPDGEELVLLDFGIAHRAGRPEERGRTSITPRYAAPEYVLRQEIGPSLDVYQLGLVIAECLCGHPVVTDAEARACLVAHASGRLELPPAVVGSALYPVVRRALDPDPSRRFPDGRAFAAALRAVSLDAADGSLEPPAPYERALPAPPRWRRAVAALSAAVRRALRRLLGRYST